MNPLTRQLFPSPTLDRWRWRSPEGPASSCRAGRTWSLQERSSSSSTPEQHAPLLHPAWSIQVNTEVYWGLLNYTREYWGILNQETIGVQTPSLSLVYWSTLSYTTSHLGRYDVRWHNLHSLFLKVLTTLCSDKVSRQWSAHNSCGGVT